MQDPDISAAQNGGKPQTDEPASNSQTAFGGPRGCDPGNSAHEGEPL